MKSPLMSSKDALFIGLGGAAGSVLRAWTTSSWVWAFPLSTLLINLLGALLLALLHVHEHRLHPHGKYLYMVGFCGSFTTVSLFSHETVVLFLEGPMVLAVLNVGISLASAFILVMLLLEHFDSPRKEQRA